MKCYFIFLSPSTIICLTLLRQLPGRLSLFEFQACNQLSCSGIYYRKYNYVSPLLLVWTSWNGNQPSAVIRHSYTISHTVPPSPFHPLNASNTFLYYVQSSMLAKDSLTDIWFDKKVGWYIMVLGSSNSEIIKWKGKSFHI